MSTIFQPPVLAGLVENLKQHREGAEKGICVQKSVYLNTKPCGLISLCFRDLSYLNEGKYFKSFNFVSVSAIKPIFFPLYSVPIKYFSILIF